MTSPQEPDPGPARPQPPYAYPGRAWYPPPDLGAPLAGYPPPPYPPPRTTSGWAIASFVLAFVCCVPLSVIFGFIALVKTKDGRQEGRGLAIAGLVISPLWALMAVVVGFVGFSGFSGFNGFNGCVAGVAPDELASRCLRPAAFR
jgi:hypothetical protein